jgi:hypothetical protein
VLSDNPTLVTPTIASFVNATHGHTNAAGGGILTSNDAKFSLTFSSNVLTLAAYGVCRVVMPSTTSGALVDLDLTGYSWTWNSAAHATPQILGRWGTTASVAWGSAMPIRIKLVNKDDTAANVKPCLTRDPVATVSPSSVNNIGYLGTAPSTSAETNIVLSYTSNTGYNSKPMMLIGVCEGTIDNSAGGSMTIVATTKRFGCHKYIINNHFSTWWDMCVEQNGGASGSFLDPDTGTPPTWATPASIVYKYQSLKDGVNRIIFSTQSAGNCTNGSDASNTFLCLPTKYQIVMNEIMAGRFAATGATTAYGVLHLDFATAGNKEVHLIQDNASVTLQANDFTNASDDLWMQFEYVGFGA